MPSYVPEITANDAAYGALPPNSIDAEA